MGENQFSLLSTPSGKRKHVDVSSPSSPLSDVQPPNKIQIQYPHAAPEWCRELIDDLNDRTFKQISDIESNFRKAIQFQDNVIADQLKYIKQLQSKSQSLQSDLATTNQQVQRLNELNTKLSEQLVRSETYSRRENLIFRGVPMSNESPIRQIRNILFNMRVPNAHRMPIARCHYLKQSAQQKQIIVRFIAYNDREIVWNHRMNLRGSGIILMEDFPHAVEQSRKELLPLASLASTIPACKNVSLVADKLTINHKVYTTKNLHELPTRLNPKYTSQKHNNTRLVFGGIFSRHHTFSNYKQRTFKCGDHSYKTLEQGYQHQKCIINNDTEMAQRILSSDDPAHARSLGHRARLQDTALWDQAKEDVMMKLLHAKFTQHDDFKAELLESGTRDIVEANSRDNYWASGLPFTNPKNLQNNFSGKNRLGKLLCILRTQLLSNS